MRIIQGQRRKEIYLGAIYCRLVGLDIFAVELGCRTGTILISVVGDMPGINDHNSLVGHTLDANRETDIYVSFGNGVRHTAECHESRGTESIDCLDRDVLGEAGSNGGCPSLICGARRVACP